MESKIEKTGGHDVWLRAKRVVILQEKASAAPLSSAGAPLIFKDCIPLRRARESILLTSLVMSEIINIFANYG